MPKPKAKQEETHDLTFVVPPGISLGLELNDAPDGNEIASVEFGSWAMVMALRPHDRLVRCGSVDVDGASSFGEILAAQRAAQSPGEPLHLVVRRKGKAPAAAGGGGARKLRLRPDVGSVARRRLRNNDPIAELGAEPIGAAAALHFYPWLAEKVPKVARRILERQERARAESGGERGLPLPAAAVHATRLVAALLHVQKPGGGVVSVKEASGQRGAAPPSSSRGLSPTLATLSTSSSPPPSSIWRRSSRRAPPECGPSSRLRQAV